MAESAPPPQNPEAEAMLLASLMAADTYVAETMSIVDVADFYREGHRAVFLARAGLLTYCEAVLEGRERGSRTIIGPQLAAAFSD